jgi:Asp/Glu/hydantoin racemase
MTVYVGIDGFGSQRAHIQRAIEEDRAEVIVLGCTMESGFMKRLMEKNDVHTATS